MNYLVWLHGLKGPMAQTHLRDPRQSLDWQLMEPRIIQIVELKDHERDYTLSQAIVAYPCPAVV